MSGSDWALVCVLFGLTSWIGHRSAARPASIRDFFLGGRRLPWYAVAASIIATEVSAVTLIGLPAIVAAPGGNLTYLQLGLAGSLIARGLVAWLLVPAFYEREIYSPYDYIGERLGEGTRRAVTVLFSLGGILGQAARVYMTALVLEWMLRAPLSRWSAASGVAPLFSCIAALGLISVAWTWMGGMASVIWTDFVLFGVFLAAIVVGLGTALAHVDGGLAGTLESAQAAGKLRLFDLSIDPASSYTLWAAMFATGLGGLGSYGTDQLMAQRIFCCRDATAARKAVLASYGAMLVTVLVGLLGLALYAYYQRHPLAGGELEALNEKPDRLFLIFIDAVIASPWKGLIVAGALAAAISSLDSILAALSQTTLSLCKGIWNAEPRVALRASRGLIALYGVLLCAVALGCDAIAARYGGVLNLALAMPLYTQGAVLAAFVLAFFGRGELSSWAAAFLPGALVGVGTTVALQWPVRAGSSLAVALALALLSLCCLGHLRRPLRAPQWVSRLALIAATTAALDQIARRIEPGDVSWVWNGLIGCAVTLALAAAWRASGPKR